MIHELFLLLQLERIGCNCKRNCSNECLHLYYPTLATVHFFLYSAIEPGGGGGDDGDGDDDGANCRALIG